MPLAAGGHAMRAAGAQPGSVSLRESGRAWSVGRRAGWSGLSCWQLRGRLPVCDRHACGPRAADCHEDRLAEGIYGDEEEIFSLTFHQMIEMKPRKEADRDG